MATIAQAAPTRRRGHRCSTIRGSAGIVSQVVLVAVVAFLFYEATTNAIDNLQRARIASGFGFLDNTAGFDVSQSLIPFSAAASTYGEAFVVGLLNTLIVAAIGVVFATILGFIIGIARLSKNWIIRKVAMVYVEVIRNLPLLLQLLFWYNAVLAPLPNPRESINIGGSFFLNNRGLFMPRPIFADAGLAASRSSSSLGIVGSDRVPHLGQARAGATGPPISRSC